MACSDTSEYRGSVSILAGLLLNYSSQHGSSIQLVNKVNDLRRGLLSYVNKQQNFIYVRTQLTYVRGVIIILRD